jgi:hypothetical protein
LWREWRVIVKAFYLPGVAPRRSAYVDVRPAWWLQCAGQKQKLLAHM